MSNVKGPPISWVSVLDHYMMEKQEEKNKEPRSYHPLRPSSAGKCAKQLAYEYAEFRGYKKFDKEPMEPNVVRLLELGHSVEYNVLRNFKSIPSDKLQVKYQQQVLRFFKLPVTQTWVEGSLDAVFISPKYKSLVDIKSKKDKHSSWAKSSWNEMAEKFLKLPSVEPIDENGVYISDLDVFMERFDDYFWKMNFYQLNMYFYDKAEFLSELGIDNCSLIYSNKNDSRLYEIRFKPSRKIYEEVKEKYERVERIVEETKDPDQVEPDHVPGSMACGFCAYNKQCRPNEDALKAFFKTLPYKKWPTDVHKIEGGQELEELHKEYQAKKEAAGDFKFLEGKIAKKLKDAGVRKARFSTGDIYEVKALKGDGLVIRRSKL